MPRIRTIKPEFFDSPGTAATSLRGRLLYIAMWCWADDYGVGPLNPSMLAFAFPHDELASKELPSLCKEIQGSYGVLFYKSGGRPYYSIPSWDKHQRTERKAKGRWPAPDPSNEPLTWEDTELPEQRKEAPSHSKEVQALEQGNRGTGEQGKVPTSSDDFVVGKIVVLPGSMVDHPNGGQILGHWLEACKKRPPAAVVARVGKSVRQMLDEGIDAADVERGLADWHAKGADPSAIPSFVNQAMNANGFRQSTSEQRVMQGAALIQHFAAMDAADGSTP